ncbi:MAG TPA: fused MFS/spermidine synthase [Pirellulaceae bacterium]|nr:fused MFS/spermidine synthase [Pirellulaceae bacterium]
MPGERSSTYAWCCALTTLISALLLFLVQPIISKLILPWYGGSPAVWTTCMLFFQTLLLAGYAYAHLLSKNLSLGWQMRIHGFVTLLAACTLPVSPSDVWEPMPEAEPVWPILKLLTFNIGLPFFALSASGPLLQSWFGNVYPGKPPYRLYALSNVGSLVSLFLFPFLFEPNLNSTQQDWIWSGGFGVYLLFIFIMAVVFERQPVDEQTVIYPEKEAGHGPLTWYDLVLWPALPALACVLMVAVTSHICQDMAVVPFLQILPLSLYLITFILAFDSPRWYIRLLWGPLAVLSLLSLTAVMNDAAVQKYLEKTAKAWDTSLRGFDLTDYTDRADIEAAVYLTAMFCVAMICHGETTRRKPSTNHLTLFYLLIAAGSALGSASVAIICPYVFDRYFELNIAVILGFLVAAAVIIVALYQVTSSKTWRYALSGAGGLLLAGCFALLLTGQLNIDKGEYDIRLRNFYGVASVKTTKSESGEPIGRTLFNGKINHGFQFLDGPERYQTVSYYAPGSGVDLAFQSLQHGSERLKVGVIGLGTGTLAANGRQGDIFRFYEIDEKIVRICNDYFTYLKDTPAEVDVVLGDARLSLAHELKRNEKQHFDILVLDAFSGDAIPVHLLTLESFKLYARHMSDRGVLAVHVSNRHLDLVPVVARLAKEMEAEAVLIEVSDNGEAHDASSDWVLVTTNPDVLNHPVVATSGQRLKCELDVLTGSERAAFHKLASYDRQKFRHLTAEQRTEFFAQPEDRRKEWLKGQSTDNSLDYSDGPLWTDKFSNLWNVLK